ncbi:MAG: TetR/AcrR family transcriptional regulator [Clostridiales bacterium]|nr:TetR/AcrR family transcriptional regulator [Clostridiales bacterium]
MRHQPIIDIPAEDPAVLSRRERKKRNQKFTIIRAAQPLFEEKGYDETSVSEIAEAADISYATFFNYFPTKDDLLRAIAHGEYEDLAEVVNLRFSPEDSIEKILFGTFQEWLEDSLKNRKISVRILEIAMKDHDDTFFGEIEQLFIDLVKLGVARGEFREDTDAEAIGFLICGLRQEIFIFAQEDLIDRGFHQIIDPIRAK